MRNAAKAFRQTPFMQRLGVFIATCGYLGYVPIAPGTFGSAAGLAVFYASSATYHNIYMLVVCLAGIIGTFLVSYTRARAESLGIDAKVGVMQRPERIVLLSAPQALFGLFWNGWVLMGIIILLSVTAWITAVQRIAFVYRFTKNIESKPIRMVSDPASPPKAGVSAPRRAQS